MIINVTTKGLSVGAKIILKQLKTLMKKSKKTKIDKEKITELKKELNADKTVKEKKNILQDKKIKTEMKESSNKAASKTDRGEAKNQATRYESGRKQEIDDAYFKGINKTMAEFGKSTKYSMGGLSTKKYANPVKIVDNRKKK